MGAAHLHPTEGAWWPYLDCRTGLRCDFRGGHQTQQPHARLWKCFSDAVGFPMALCPPSVLPIHAFVPGAAHKD